MSNEELLKTYAADVAKLARHPVIVQMDFVTALAVVAMLQLAFRHPRTGGPAKQLTEQFAVDLARDLAVTPAIETVLLRGFDPAFDVTSEVNPAP